MLLDTQLGIDCLVEERFSTTSCWTSYWTVMLSSPGAVSTPSDFNVEIEDNLEVEAFSSFFAGGSSAPCHYCHMQLLACDPSSYSSFLLTSEDFFPVLILR